MDQDIVATLTPSLARRAMAVTALSLVGALLLWVAATTPPEKLGWLVFMVGVGALFIWVSWLLWKATGRQIVLTRDGIFDSSGACLARMDNITSVERGVFAFKPSGGFVVRLKTAPGRDWAPGLWWRFGKLLGVGGVTPNAQGKVLAEMITLVLQDRNAAGENFPSEDAK